MKVMVIFNPRAGTGKRRDIARLAMQYFPGTETVVEETASRGHAFSLAREAVREGCGLVLAAGGDGTVNEAARGLEGSSAALAIIPCGSGNGLARHLGIPQNIAKAMRLAAAGNVKIIDALDVNGVRFFNVAGVGFDGFVAREFASRRKRGLMAYASVIMKNISSFPPTEYELLLDGKPMRVKARLIAIANSRQYGNNFVIAPHASVTDGFMDVCMVESMRELIGLRPAMNYLAGGSYRIRKISTVKAQTLEVNSREKLQLHVDGEPLEMEGPLRFTVHRAALAVITA